MTGSESRIIFVDDDESVRIANGQSLRLAGLTVDLYGDARSALAGIGPDFEGVVVSDIQMPEMDGLQLLRAIQEVDPGIPVIMITGHGDVPMAVAALKAGAHDFLTKPFAADHLIASVRRAGQMRSLLLENRRLHEAADLAARKSPLIGETPAMVRLRETIAQVGAANVDVIVEGETGTGKELVALMVHRASRRRLQAFVPVACGAAAPELVESDLFGDRAPSQARGGKAAPVEAAHRGTLFLDDADRLSQSAQSRLMRVLDDGVLITGGSAPARPIEINVIASCKGDLHEAVREGRFREDLYYRLDTARLRLPPLRERKADVPLLFAHFVGETLPRSAREMPEIPEAVRRRLIDHHWPGNARELKSFAMRFALGLLDIEESAEAEAETPSLAERVRLYEESLIRHVLARCRGDVSAALAELQLPRKTFYDKLGRHGIDIAGFRGR